MSRATLSGFCCCHLPRRRATREKSSLSLSLASATLLVCGSGGVHQVKRGPSSTHLISFYLQSVHSVRGPRAPLADYIGARVCMRAALNKLWCHLQNRSHSSPHYFPSVRSVDDFIRHIFRFDQAQGVWRHIARYPIYSIIIISGAVMLMCTCCPVMRIDYMLNALPELYIHHNLFPFRLCFLQFLSIRTIFFLLFLISTLV